MRERHPQDERASARSGLISTLLMLPVLLLGLACGEEGLTLPPGASNGGGGTGSVSVFLTDAPSDDFVAVNVTVLQIDLLGGPAGPVSVFQGRETFDLLSLRNVSELFSSDDDVPAGHYSKIRMTLEDLELVLDDGAGGFERQHPNLPGNGKLDLLPKGGFFVRAGESLGLEIDIDCEKSIHAHPNGKGEYKFRPVVFVRVIRNVFDGRLVRLHGVIENVEVASDDEKQGSFELCRMLRPIAWPLQHQQGGMAAGEERDHANDDRWHPYRRCIDVTLLADGAIFDEYGNPIRLGSVEQGDRATVVGRVAPMRDEKKLEMLAHLVLLGQPGTFRTLHGIVDTELNDDDQFDLAIAPGQGYTGDSVLTVQLFPTSKLFSRSGMAISRDEIELDLRAAATGVIVLSSSDPDVIRTAVLILDLEEPGREKHSGVIERLDVDARKLSLGDPDSFDSICVDVAERALIFLIEDGMSHEVELSDLELGDGLDVYGRPGDGECFVGHILIAFPGEEPTPTE